MPLIRKRKHRNDITDANNSSCFDRLRAAWAYRPLVAALALQLALPSLTAWNHKAGQAAHSPFTASAQTSQRPGDRLFITSPLAAYEDELVLDYITTHGLTAADVPLVYQYGRSDLRNDIRAYILAYLIKILSAPAASLNARDASIAQYFTNQLKQKEAEIYDTAIAERKKEKSQGCKYALDADIATQLDIPQFNPNCHTFGYGANFIEEPAKDYFLAVGYKKVYGGLVNGEGVARAAVLSSRMMTSIAIATTGVVAGFAAGLLTNSAVIAGFTTIFPYAVKAFSFSLARAIAANPAGISGPGAVVTLAIVIGVMGPSNSPKPTPISLSWTPYP